MLFRIITWIFVIGILVRLFSRYIYPIVRVTSVAKDQLRQMQDQINEMNRKATEQAQQPKTVQKEGDYIDYEEVR